MPTSSDEGFEGYSEGSSESAQLESSEVTSSHSKSEAKPTFKVVDFNHQVDEILEGKFGCATAPAKPPKKSKDIIRKRNRKSKEQIKFLENEYLKEQNWSKAHMRALSKKIGLSMGQIYKWNWDQRKKTMTEEERHAEMFLINRSQ